MAPCLPWLSGATCFGMFGGDIDGATNTAKERTRTAGAKGGKGASAAEQTIPGADLDVMLKELAAATVHVTRARHELKASSKKETKTSTEAQPDAEQPTQMVETATNVDSKSSMQAALKALKVKVAASIMKASRVSRKSLQNSLPVVPETEPVAVQIEEEVLQESRLGGFGSTQEKKRDLLPEEAQAAKKLLQLLMAAGEPADTYQLSAWLEQDFVSETWWHELEHLFDVRDGVVYRFHDSIVGILQEAAPEPANNGMPIWFDACLGHEIISNHIISQMSEAITQVVKDPSIPVPAYILRHAVLHYAHAGKVPELAALVVDFNYWSIVLRAGMVVDILADLITVAEQGCRGQPPPVAVLDAVRWLQRDWTFLVHAPDAVLQLALDTPEGSAIRTAAWECLATVRVPGVVAGVPTQWPLHLVELAGHMGPVIHACFSPTTGELATVGSDGSLRVWDPLIGTQLATVLQKDWHIAASCYSPNGLLLASSGQREFDVRIWDAARTAMNYVSLAGHQDMVTCLAFSPDCTTLASGSRDRTVQIWDVTAGVRSYVMRGHGKAVTALAFATDGRMLASASSDMTVQLWELGYGTQMKIINTRSTPATCLAFSPCNSWLVGGSARAIWLWNVETGALIKSLHGHWDTVHSVCFSHNGATIASAGADATIRLWSFDTGRTQAVLKVHGETVTSISFSPDGTTLASTSQDGTARIWDVSTIGMIAPEPGQAIPSPAVPPGHMAPVTNTCFSPDGVLMVSGGRDATVRMWDTIKGQQIITLKGHSREITAVAFAPDGSTFASGSADGGLMVWDPVHGSLVVEMSGHQDMVTCLAYSTSSRMLMSGSSDHGLRLWNTRVGRIARYMKGHTATITTVAFAKGDLWLASGSEDGAIKIWQVKAGQVVYNLSGHDGCIQALSWSNDCLSLVSAGGDGFVRVWNPATGKQQSIIAARLTPTAAFACATSGTCDSWVSNDRGLLVSGEGEDTCVGIWDLKTGTNVCMRANLDDAIIVGDSVLVPRCRVLDVYAVKNLEHQSRVYHAASVKYRTLGCGQNVALISGPQCMFYCLSKSTK